MRLIDVTLDTVDRTGFFCLMSRRKAPGYQQKLAWLRARFAEGLTIKLLDLADGGRGFIEYLPGAHAWRPVYADDYMFVHCLWVVGQSRGKGYSQILLDACLADAQHAGLAGVAMVSSERSGLVSGSFLAHQGFQQVDTVPPAFTLWAKTFRADAPTPRFPTDWDERCRAFGPGLTVITSAQCPYNVDAAETALGLAAEYKLPSRVVTLTSSGEVRERAPSPYGVYSIVVDGQIVANQFTLRRELTVRLGIPGQGAA